MKQVVDVTAAGAAGVSFIGIITGYVAPILAALASLFAIAWYGVRFYEYIQSKRRGDSTNPFDT